MSNLMSNCRKGIKGMRGARCTKCRSLRASVFCCLPIFQFPSFFNFSDLSNSVRLLNFLQKKVMAYCGEREEARQFRYLCFFICICLYLPIVFSCLWVQMCLLNSPHKKVMASGGEEARQVFLRKVLAQDVGSSTNQQPATVEN